MAKTSLNKSAWIRAQPASLSAKEMVEKAKREGFSLSPAMVYTVRSTSAKASTSTARASQRRAAAPHTRQRTTADASSLHGQFQQLAVRLGTEEAQHLLAQLPVLVLAGL
jgi:hypothetical protein